MTLSEIGFKLLDDEKVEIQLPRSQLAEFNATFIGAQNLAWSQWDEDETWLITSVSDETFLAFCDCLAEVVENDKAEVGLWIAASLIAEEITGDHTVN